MEVVGKQVRKLAPCLDKVLLRCLPGKFGIENFCRYSSEIFGNWEIENRVVFKLRLLELSVMDGVNDGTGILQRDTASNAVSTSIPSSVYKVSIGLMFGHLLSKHAGIFDRVPHQEWLTEASRESGLRFSDAL